MPLRTLILLIVCVFVWGTAFNLIDGWTEPFSAIIAMLLTIIGSMVFKAATDVWDEEAEKRQEKY